MEFTLYYEGPLKSRGSKEAKHRLRKHFHPQLNTLWDQEPLRQFESFRRALGDPMTRHFHGFAFTSIINNTFHYVAELDIILLRSEPIGNIVNTTGDIDNRLKTLLDALRMPDGIDELPRNLNYKDEEKPCCCLLQDDSLISVLRISTKQLLVPGYDPKNVILIIDVVAKKIATMMGGMEPL